jgi:ribose transport system ATP-binding protein
MNETSDYIIQAHGICKSFGPTVALADVDLFVKRGEVRGLIGENGSGKSTLSSIIAGIHKADQGTLILENKQYNPDNPVEAIEHGVSMVVQEQGTIDNVTVAANIFLGKESNFTNMGYLNVKAMREEAAKALSNIGVASINPRSLINDLVFEDRKLVELARAYHNNPKLWIIDETTTALTVEGRDILYNLMEKIKDNGGSVIFISHDIEEIMEKCDSLTILRDGVVTANLDKADFSADSIRELMIGRTLSAHYYRQDNKSSYSSEVVLEAKNLTTDALKNVSVQLHRGEILGIGGLGDSGMHDLGRVMFGLSSRKSGTVIKDSKHHVKNATWSVRNGIAYVSKNRDKESLMLIGSIRDNICIPSYDDLSRYNFISRKSERRLSEKWSQEMEVKSESVERFCSTLSGGNKQKVVLAKWLGKGSSILILDCPTRGIDVGTKASIYHLIEQLKEQGKSIILISEELPELIGMSDRIIIFRNGEIAGTFNREDNVTESKLIQKMI